jgi:hypothetical protein
VTEYRRITVDELSLDLMAVEVYSHATGEWVPAEVYIDRAGHLIIRRDGVPTEGRPLSHGITARVAVEETAPAGPPARTMAFEEAHDVAMDLFLSDLSEFNPNDETTAADLTAALARWNVTVLPLED